MNRRAFASMPILAAAIAVVYLASSAAQGQARKERKEWTPARTPWGDADISGNFTNLYELHTPFERPDEFAGRRIEDIKGEELAHIRRGIEERTKAEYLREDTFGLGGGIRHIWVDSWDNSRGSRAWLVVDPADGKIPPLTPEGRRRAAASAASRQDYQGPPPTRGVISGFGPADGPEDRSLWDRCITRGLPGSMMPGTYGNSYQIVQGQGWVGIRYEMVHETRIIPLDGRAHLSKNIRLDMGDARGHWEGDTLVVETTNFKQRSVYRNANPDSLRLIERFTRVAPDKIRWAVTVNDPATWTRDWTFEVPLTMNDREPIMPYECHEGNYAMTGILSAGRADEKAVEKDVK